MATDLPSSFDERDTAVDLIVQWYASHRESPWLVDVAIRELLPRGTKGPDKLRGPHPDHGIEGISINEGGYLIVTLAPDSRRGSTATKSPFFPIDEQLSAVDAARLSSSFGQLPSRTLARSGLGDFHHPAPPQIRLAMLRYLHKLR